VTLSTPVASPPQAPNRSTQARFISRGQLTARALYWLGWLAFSRRSVVTSGVEREVYALGIGALRLVASASLLVGLIAIFQVATQLAPYGAEPVSPRVVTWFAARELGPVVVAMLLVARSSAAIAGELASMNVTGEIDALRAMGLDLAGDVHRRKLLAVIIVLPALTLISDALILGGVWVGSTVFLGYSTDRFVSQIREAFLTRDLGVGIGKSIIFALIIAVIASDEGLSADRRASAIGEAATRAVVYSLILVLGADTFVNAIFYFIPGLI
jgi:phospholipid/cholesterol/gamma-HCH transport system permease protein